MNRANQQVLFQATNQGLLGIRQQEITYYLNLNLAFGTQAALIGGFTYGVFTQNQINPENKYAEVIEDIYWIMSAATIAASVHVIVNTMLLQVLGPGLALHGPVGSIVRATEGMKVEQKQIVSSFILMMVLFASSTTLSFWVVMSYEAAIGSTIVFILAARQWYYYTERIYLRFHWDHDKNAWDERDSQDEGEESDDLSPLQRSKASLNSITDVVAVVPKKKHDSKESFDETRQNTRQNSVGSNNGVNSGRRFGKFFAKFGKKTDKIDKNKAVTANGIMDKYSAKGANGAIKQIAMEGYLGKSGTTAAAVIPSYGQPDLTLDNKKEPWERRYFTLNRAGLLYFYKNRLDYRTDPKTPLNKRPLNLLEYNIHVSNTDQDGRRTSSMDNTEAGSNSDDENVGMIHRTSLNFFTTSSVVSNVPSNRSPLLPQHTRHHFQMTLVLKDEEGSLNSRRWLLRCDTEEELDVWISIMKEVSPNSFVGF